LPAVFLVGWMLLGAGAGAASAAPHTRTRAPRFSPESVAPGEVRRLVDLVNRHRRSIGLAPLTWNDRAARVAEAHSRDMVQRGFFSHRDPDGRSPFDRVRRAGIRFRAAGENIAAGQLTADEVFRDWMASKGHRENIEGRMYTQQGIGVYRNHWTHLFLTPR